MALTAEETAVQGELAPTGEPEPLLVDTHCHLFLMEGEPGELVDRARAAGVGALVCAGIDPETSRRSREIADSIAGVFATAGLHPHDATRWDTAAGSAIEELLSDPRVVAVGEAGLDHYRLHSPPDVQERVFRAQCALAREVGKPLVVHVREAWPEAMRVLEEERVERVILHCFSGDVAEAREAAARGYVCSFAGNLTYPKNDHLRRAAAEVPAPLLVAETDSPYLAPQALRGRDNEPGNVAMVVAALAEIRGSSVGEMTALTSGNARRAFGLPL